MQITQRPTHQDVCDLVQAITGSYDSILCDLDAHFANTITGKTQSRWSTTIMALRVYEAMSSAYFWAHRLDCDGCNQSTTQNFSGFWGQYYAYSQAGCTSKKVESEWPEGTQECAKEFLEKRKEYESVFEEICELCAQGLPYSEARERVKNKLHADE